jgi:hypothetical protein
MIISVNNINLLAFVNDMRPIFFEAGIEHLLIVCWNLMFEDLETKNGYRKYS